MSPAQVGFLLSFLNISGATLAWMAISWGLSDQATALLAAVWLLLPVCAARSVFNWGWSIRDPTRIYRTPIVRTITRQRSDGTLDNKTRPTGRYTSTTLTPPEALSRFFVLLSLELIIGLTAGLWARSG